MSGPVTLTFVGGPEDGKRVALRSPPGPRYRVAMLPKLPTHIDPDEEVTIDFQQFEYGTYMLPGKNLVAYPAEWEESPDGFVGRLLTALTRGYVGRT